ncbi:hypothetical protein ACLQ2P_22705 [Actinomadura citrea]|uniref:hypothetical protein n=1 Tax=Actinomadura citrea TaxID=46158 RepID=UPI003CE48E3A
MNEDTSVSRSAADAMPKEVQDHLSALADQLNGLAVAILPTGVRDGKAYYLETDAEARKLARSVGLEAKYLYDAHNRAYLHEYSADWVINLAIAIGHGISTELVVSLGKYIFARARSAVRRGQYDGDENRLPLRVTIQQVKRNDQGEITFDGLAFEGETQAVVASLREALIAMQEAPRSREIESGGSGNEPQ